MKFSLPYNTLNKKSISSKKGRHQKLMSICLKNDFGTKNLKSKLRSEVSSIIWYTSNTEKSENDHIILSSKQPNDKKT